MADAVGQAVIGHQLEASKLRPTKAGFGPLSQFVSLSFLAGIWLLSHRYYGIRHDGVLYAAQGMLRLHPDIFASDLFFMGGSQDDYSFFGTLYAYSIARLTLPVASLLFVVVGQIAWFAAAVVLLRQLLPQRHWLAAATFVLCVPCFYGIGRILQVAETFATARLFAEVLGLFALAAAVSGRSIRALMLASLALPLHPLMALAPTMVVATMMLSDRWPSGAGRPRWLSLPIVAVVVVSLGISASALIPRMDAVWYAMVRTRAPLVTPDAWTTNEWAAILLPLVLLDAVRRIEVHDRIRMIWIAAQYAGSIALVLTLAAAYTSGVLLLQGQPWRVGWLITFLATIGVARAAIQVGLTRPVVAHLLWAALPGLVLAREVGLEVGGCFSLAAALLLHICLWMKCDDDRVSIRVAAGVMMALVASAALWSGVKGYVDVVVQLESGASTGHVVVAGLESQLWIVAPILGWWIQGITASGTSRWIVARVAVSCAVLVAGLLYFDARRPEARYIERLMTHGLPEWDAVIPDNATVYWQGPATVIYPWFVLKRASYLSTEQVAGIVFSRIAAEESFRRLEYTEGVGLPAKYLNVHRVLRPRNEELPLTVAGLARLCSDRSVDFAVLRHPLDGGFVTHYHEGPTRRTYYLYDCRARRPAIRDSGK